MGAERYILVTEGNCTSRMLEEIRRQMLRLKMMGWKTTGARLTGKRALAGVVMLGLTATVAVQAQVSNDTTSTSTETATTRTTTLSKIGPQAPVTYDNRYEIYGGLNFMNFQAGQNLPKRMNLGGGELLGTYWVMKHLGVAADYRIDAGTTPVLPNLFVNNRPLVYMNIGMLGVQYRGPKNQFVAVNYHAYGGVAAGTFSYSLKDVPLNRRNVIGLYGDSIKPMVALGGSIDFNRTKNWAVRVSPDLILEHFGSETREFVSVSGGVVYRFHKKQ
jgi:hypothetical protein